MIELGVNQLWHRNGVHFNHPRIPRIYSWECQIYLNEVETSRRKKDEYDQNLRVNGNYHFLYLRWPEIMWFILKYPSFVFISSETLFYTISSIFWSNYLLIGLQLFDSINENRKKNSIIRSSFSFR